MRIPTRVLPLALLLATGSLLGLSTNLAKVAAGAGLEPLPWLAWSVTGAATVLTAVGAARGRLPPLTARTAEYFVVSGLLSVAVPTLLLFAAIPHVGAGFVALALAFPPMFTYLGALALGVERFRPLRGAGVGLALCGATLLAALALADPEADPRWIAATLAGPLLLAAGNLYRTLRWPPGAAPDALAPGMLGASALLLLTVGVAAPGLSLNVPLDRPEPILLLLLQVATYAVQYLLFFALQSRGGPVYLSLLGSVGAVVGVPIAVILLGEAAPHGLAAGGALIAVGVGLLTFGASSERPGARPPGIAAGLLPRPARSSRNATRRRRPLRPAP